MTAEQRWREQLEAWAIPEELLAGVDESPYEWPVDLWRRRSASIREDREEPLTTAVVRGFLRRPGSLVDVGAGTGRASLPLAEEGHSLVAVERDTGMAEGLREEVARRSLSVEVVEGAWPEASARVGRADVVMSAHVVYDVQDILPFLTAMEERADRAVVLEMTPAHPWSDLAPAYRALHGLERPDGPRVEDLVRVVEELRGAEPTVREWQRPGGLWFESWEEILTFYGRRLVLPRHRRHELRELLGPAVVEDAGRLFVGARERRLCTVWWEV